MLTRGRFLHSAPTAFDDTFSVVSLVEMTKDGRRGGVGLDAGRELGVGVFLFDRVDDEPSTCFNLLLDQHDGNHVGSAANAGVHSPSKAKRNN